jgi:DNA-binding CsgD family transcriptional regulator
MGAVEHLKTLCCLGLKPESAMIAVTPLLHEIIPHSWARLALIAPDASWTASYSENPGAAALYRERFGPLMQDPTGLGPLYLPAVRAVGIGWTLPLQARNWLERAWFKEIEAPLDACWILDTMVGESGRTIALVHLLRPRCARPYTADDAQRLDHLRPWLAHAFRSQMPDAVETGDPTPPSSAAAPARSGQMILQTDTTVIWQTPSVEFLLRILAGEPSNYLRPLRRRDALPAPILNLVQRLIGAANGSLCKPPRIRISTAYGVLTLEAKWLMPAGAIPDDTAKNPMGCVISVTIELHEHVVAHAARVLRESGATPAQMKVGVQLALGKAKAAIADELDLKQSTVADLTKKLYQTLDIHSSAEFARKVWLDEDRINAHEYEFPRRPASARMTEARCSSLFAPSYKSLTQLED